MKIKNTGNEPLQIFNVLLRCQNCVEVLWPEVAIKPGETSEIVFQKNENFPTGGVEVEIISNAVPSRVNLHLNP